MISQPVWRDWTVVGSGETLKLYSQGVYKGSLAYPATVAGDVFLGRHWWMDGGLRYSTRFQGEVDELRFYNRGLSEEEVRQLSVATRPVRPPHAYDAWAQANGLAELAAGLGDDPDGDGWTNSDEYVFGTHPRLAPFLADGGRIERQPASGEALVGSEVVPGPASELPWELYQWLKEGEPLLGETQPTLRFRSAQKEHTGIYLLIVSNALGAVRSQELYFRVTAPLAATVKTISITTPSAGLVTVVGLVVDDRSDRGQRYGDSHGPWFGLL